ncbi:aminocarboxymuconate-semialdehyde decarboxylase [Paraburkholderia sp. BL23I1N1]|uniref:amidohydrolase family protein n=1 Tax=Paraburkholderia sp. BL23I1N1 TaxID=1938802 RepID=UPI000E75B29B|nr:amidohydrolase family protein [Paraburkholderia sp. BL23I1N1]RKE36342.1 aminocarboxymuconate-semialdehyde decarboxylase [Paraburkholderia sp. BL23I1N1]
MTTAHRIDVHQHVVPPFWAAGLPSHGGDRSGTVVPHWSPQSALDMMDTQQIATGILSLTAPSVAGWKAVERWTMARRVNEYTADLVAKHPDRFGNFATLPLPDIDNALLELDYALDTLHADGVILLSNYDGNYLAEPVFDRLWAELDRRRAVVFIHPGLPQIQGLAGVAAPMVDYPFDTTRAAVQLVVNGVVDRYPRVRIILAHAGGFLPYASHRFAQLARVFRPEADSPADILAKFKRFYFDTALSASPAAIPALKAFAGSGRILFGSDFPYVSADIADTFTSQLDAYNDLTAEERSGVNHANAWTLFPRLAPKDKPSF